MLVLGCESRNLARLNKKGWQDPASPHEKEEWSPYSGNPNQLT